MLQDYLVVGLGITGYSVVEYLVNNGCKVSVSDTRDNPPYLAQLKDKFPNIDLYLGKLVIPTSTTHIVLSPGMPLTTPEINDAIKHGVQICGDIELFARVVDKPVLAITGSNGKSTTTALLGAMAAACDISAGVGGNLGQPALSLLNSTHDCYILELSSFQLETTKSLNCVAATVLNISPDHMDRYATVEDYAAAKKSVFAQTKTAVVNRQDKYAQVTNNYPGHVITFGLDAPTEENYGVIVRDKIAWLAKGTQLLMPVHEMSMLGSHNVANALAALAMGQIAGFCMDKMLAALRSFKGLEHRCEKVVKANDVIWINDSKGTNVGATLAAIEGLSNTIKGKWIIILGGVGKNADFRALIEPLTKHCRAAILIGQEAPLLHDLLKDKLKCVMVQDFAAAIICAKAESKPNDGILLSPACASFDMFENFVARGNKFKQLVLQETGYSINATQNCI